MQFDLHFNRVLESFGAKPPRYKVEGEVVFVNPYGTGRQHVRNVNTIVYAFTQRQALYKAVKDVARRRKFIYSEFIPSDSKVTITKLPDEPPPELRLPYKDN